MIPLFASAIAAILVSFSSRFLARTLGTGWVKSDGYNGETEWVVRNELSKV